MSTPPSGNSLNNTEALGWATCEQACLQQCGAMSLRVDCEAAQVRCGCAAGMRRPPLGRVTATEAEASPPAPSAPSAPVPECFGPGVPLTVWAATPYAEVRIGGATGLFLIDFGTTGSTIDRAAFRPSPDGSAGCYSDLDFMGPWHCLRLSGRDHSAVGTPFRQAGIFGTDVLGEHSYLIDYRAHELHRAGDAFCSPEALTAGDFVALSTTGYGPGRVRARVHIPSVLVRIGGASAPAQVDTGFADRRVAHSININQAFFDAIAASGTTLVRRPESDLSLSTCVSGVRESVLAYGLPPGSPLTWLGSDLEVARSWDDAVVFLKNTPPAARSCGGIGTWSEPGAQLGASFLESVGQVVFDTRNGLVWVALAP